VCGSGRREEEAEQTEQTRDTESKTRTLHKVVGKNFSLALLVEVQMSKKCTSLWREVHFEVKMYKAQGFGPLWRFRCCFVWQAQGVQKCDHI